MKKFSSNLSIFVHISSVFFASNIGSTHLFVFISAIAFDALSLVDIDGHTYGNWRREIGVKLVKRNILNSS